jgi:hypothetical protein
MNGREFLGNDLIRPLIVKGFSDTPGSPLVTESHLLPHVTLLCPIGAPKIALRGYVSVTWFTMLLKGPMKLVEPHVIVAVTPRSAVMGYRL